MRVVIGGEKDNRSFFNIVIGFHIHRKHLSSFDIIHVTSPRRRMLIAESKPRVDDLTLSFDVKAHISIQAIDKFTIIRDAFPSWSGVSRHPNGESKNKYSYHINRHLSDIASPTILRRWRYPLNLREQEWSLILQLTYADKG